MKRTTVPRLIASAASGRVPYVVAQTPCNRHTWCTETGEHDEHSGESVDAMFLNSEGQALMSAALMHWSKGVRVGFLEEDLTPAEARVKVAELQAHLNAVERLIDTAEAGE